MALCETCSHWAREASDQVTEHHPACPHYVAVGEGKPPPSPAPATPPPVVDGTDFRDGPWRM